MTLHFFVGWDSREQEAYDVCVHSLVRHASVPVQVHPLKHRDLRKKGLFWREWRIDGPGQFWDIEDGKPFSTEFAHSRFLTVHLAREIGLKKAFFVDADFLFLADVAKLDAAIDWSLPVSVVKHDFSPTKQIKMDGMAQARYARKNWSSLMAFRVNHPSNSRLSPECVSMADGSWLHGFQWLQDWEIGDIDPAWNQLVGHNADLETARALHFTSGGPWFEEWPHGDPMDELWRRERDLMRRPTPSTALKLRGEWAYG